MRAGFLLTARTIVRTISVVRQPLSDGDGMMRWVIVVAAVVFGLAVDVDKEALEKLARSHARQLLPPNPLAGMSDESIDAFLKHFATEDDYKSRCSNTTARACGTMIWLDMLNKHR
jgi:hypothetical protein